MAEINFDALDLNLLRVFDALYLEGSTTRAGERLNLSQSAISHALGRLRHILKDELFVRSASGMTPTALSLEIGPTVHQLLSQLRSALSTPKFEPGKSEKVFTIACGDYTTSVLLPALVARIGDSAPGIHLRMVPIHPTNVTEMHDGLIDLILADFGHVPDQFSTEFLIEDKVVLVMRKGNPHARPPLTLKQLSEVPLVVPSFGIREEDRCSAESLTNWRGLEIRGGWHLGLLSELEQQRDMSHMPAPRRVTTISILSAIDLVSKTDFVAVIPARMVAGKADPLGLEVLELPQPSLPTPSKSLSLQMVWHRTHGAQPSVLWLRDLLRDVALEVNAGPVADFTKPSVRAIR
jgi:DNA-binding transcriptional LysR family regulator